MTAERESADSGPGHRLDFHFFEPPQVAAAMEAPGLVVEARLERVSYPGEVDTRRGYLLARRPA